MQNSLRTRTQNQIKDILCDENFQNQQIYFELISPWSDENSQLQENPKSILKSQNKPKRPLTQNGYEQLKRMNTSNLRIRTQQSKNLNHQTIQNFNDNCHDFNNFFSSHGPIEKIRKTPSFFKKNLQFRSRQKFRTPIVNLNQYSFTQDWKMNLQDLLSKASIKQKPTIKHGIHLAYRPYSKQKQNSRPLGKEIKEKQKKQKKFSTHKTLSAHKFSLSQQKKLPKDMISLNFGNGKVIQNIKKLMTTQIRPVVKSTKSRSLNKLSKTFYSPKYTQKTIA